MLNVRVYAARALKFAGFCGSDVTPGSNLSVGGDHKQQ